MKIQCDVCQTDEASVFCAADDAALCGGCDRRVHHANKLAVKHRRFSLHRAASPICDICQEKKGFLFCHQDRAILCRQCDSSIHAANELTQKHTRFLLTGQTLSENPTVNYSSSSSSSSTSPEKPSPAADSSLSSSRISDYFIQTLPGWHFDEFLDSSFDPFSTYNCNDSYQSGGTEVGLPFLDEHDLGHGGDLDSGNNNNSTRSGFPIGQMELWVPQAPQPPLQYDHQQHQLLTMQQTPQAQLLYEDGYHQLSAPIS
ncbi:B-box zinc finger protein 21-like [Andrographis paniculata]|uniref:B-box zinc finger protein 21-like n=1 Tax=Andrographis paniculata TaxID=175694 RepID=UPI0021E84523|nr:B-box zinc finger protein 21-like [Andrographis paniculata]